MSKTRTDSPAVVETPAAAPTQPDQPPRILIASPDDSWAGQVMSTLGDAGMTCVAAGTTDRAAAILAASKGTEDSGPAFDAALIDLGLAGALGPGLAGSVREGGAVLLAVCRDAGVGDAVAAMRAGAADLLDKGGVGTNPRDLIVRVSAAAERSRSERRQRDRLSKLEGLCRLLDRSRSLVAREVEALCDDLLLAYQEMSRQMNQVTVATEFKGLIRHELDIESLLRTTLEFVLARSGPTNAAVFLPTTSGDFSLGAYVNYDCPKDTCDILLDHMANVIAPRFENSPGLVHLTTPDALERFLGDEAQWLGDSHVVGFPCGHDGECLAIFMLFRDRATPFPVPLLDQLKTIGELFAAQLARVIHIHHRHLPKDKWGMIGDGEDETRGDDYGLAA